MLKSIFTKSLIAGSILVGASAVTSTANAGNFNVQITPDFAIDVHFKGKRRGGHKGHRGHRGHHGHFQPYYHPQPQYHSRPNRHFCGPRKAVKRAWKRHGINNPYVHRVGQRRIVVRGWQWGYQTKLVFDRYSNCRVIKKVHLGH